MIKKLFFQLEKQGYKGRILSVKHLPELREEIEKWRRQNMFFHKFYQECLTGFDFNLPSDLFEAKSLIVVAAPQPIIQVLFNWNGKSVPLTIPPTYSYTPDEHIKNLLKKILEPHRYHIARATLPLKILAVRSELASYGKNNISYIPGMGSFYRLVAFYSDFSCQEDVWLEPQTMKHCHNCSACLDNCPTGAISSGRFLLHAERCITFHNERKANFPSWLNPYWHNCVVGCLLCQTVCPQNRSFINWIEYKGEFSKEESALIFNGASMNRLSPETLEKLEQLGLIEYFGFLPRNIRVLLRD